MISLGRILLMGLHCCLIRCRNKQWVVSQSSLEYWLVENSRGKKLNAICTLDKQVVMDKVMDRSYPLDIEPFKTVELSMNIVKLDDYYVKESDKVFVWPVITTGDTGDDDDGKNSRTFRVYKDEMDYWREWQYLITTTPQILTKSLEFKVRDKQDRFRNSFLRHACPIITNLTEIPLKGLKELFATKAFLEIFAKDNESWAKSYLQEYERGLHQAVYVSPETCWKQVTNELNYLETENFLSEWKRNLASGFSKIVDFSKRAFRLKPLIQMPLNETQAREEVLEEVI